MEEVDELHTLQRRIQLRSALIDYTFLQDDGLKLTDEFIGDGTVAEGVQNLLGDVDAAAAAIKAVLTRDHTGKGGA